MSPSIRAALLGAALALAAPSVGFASDWSILSMSGLVKVSSSGQWVDAGERTTLRHGAWIKTGTKGELVLERDGIRVSVRPRTIMAVADLANEPGTTALVQRLGSATVEVQKRETPRLKVHTPFLAAIVKGTTFDVEVDRCYTEFGVHEGRIAVEDAPRGMATEIGAGQSAGAGRGEDNAITLEGEGEAAPMTRIPKGSGVVPGIAREEVVSPGNVWEPAMRLPPRSRG